MHKLTLEQISPDDAKRLGTIFRNLQQLLYKQLEELHKEFTEHVYFYGKDNPNTENILKAINSRYKAIQLLINTSDFPALTNNK